MVKSKWMLLLFVLLLASAPLTSLAGDVQQAADAPAQSDDTETLAPQAMAPGCPGGEDGKCCGACQQRARLTKKPAAEVGGCPCQRARQAAESQPEPQ